MSGIYTRSAATAKRLLTRFGQTMTLRRDDGGGHDPVTGETTPNYVTQGVTAAVFPATGGTVQAFDNRFSGEGLSTSGLRNMVVAADSVDFEPEEGHEVQIEGQWWMIIGVTPLAPAGTTVVYNATARR